MKVLLVGGSGFVGSATRAALEQRGIEATVFSAPRLDAVGADRARATVRAEVETHGRGLCEAMAGHDAVINAAGAPDASSRNAGGLIAANSVLPAVLARTALEAGAGRFVHVSSAVVQGQAPVLDQSADRRPFSAYSESKALGEELLEELGDPRVVIYRPPSVHGPDRRITRVLTRVARSPLSTVASPGTGPTPQSHIDNVADAICYLATSRQQPPSVVIHPWEGFSTAEFMQMLGGRPPRLLPRWLTRLITQLLRLAGEFIGPVTANARRLDMMWHGQAQAQSWLSVNGWHQPAGMSEWLDLARQVTTTQARTDKV